MLELIEPGELDLGEPLGAGHEAVEPGHDEARREAWANFPREDIVIGHLDIRS